MSLIIDRATGEEWDDNDSLAECPNCGESDADLCGCIDCGTGLCCNCAVSGRCDSFDCDFLVEDDA